MVKRLTEKRGEFKMAYRIMNVDALSKGTKVSDVFKNEQVDVVVDLFSEGDIVYITEKVDVEKTGFKYGIVGRGKVASVEKVEGRGKLTVKLVDLVQNEIINLAHLKELGEAYWFQRYLRMPVEIGDDKIINWLNETIEAGGIGLDQEKSKEAIGVVEGSKEEAKAESNVVEMKRDEKPKATRAKRGTGKTASASGEGSEKKTTRARKTTAKKVEAKPTGTGTRKRVTKKVVAGSEKVGSKSATKVTGAKATGATTRTRTRKTGSKVVVGSGQRRAARRGGTGAVLDRTESAVLHVDGSSDLVKVPMNEEFRGVVEKFGEVVKSDVGTRIEIDMKGKDMQIVYHRILNNDKESDLERFNFFVDEIVGNLMKMRGKLEWVSESEKEMLYADVVEQVMNLLREDSEKANKVLKGLRTRKNEQDWELGLRLRETVMNSLMDSKNVKMVYEVYGLTDIQKSGLENLAKELKLNVELVLH